MKRAMMLGGGVILIAVGVCGCDLFRSSETPPIRMDSLVFFIGGYQSFDSALGVAAGLTNTGDSTITAAQVEFSLFDEEESPLPSGQENRFSIQAALELQPDETVTLIIPLDDSFWFVPTGNVEVREFFLREIAFDDGTVWQDEFGIYAFPYPNMMVVSEGGNE